MKCMYMVKTLIFRFIKIKGYYLSCTIIIVLFYGDNCRLVVGNGH